jgi:hypothetical protein
MRRKLAMTVRQNARAIAALSSIDCMPKGLRRQIAEQR